MCRDSDVNDIWRKYMYNLLNDWDGDVDCHEVMGPRLMAEEGWQQLLKD